MVRALRPRQWAKNVLLLAAPAAAGVLDQGSAIADVSVAIAVFCLVSSGTYLLNDLVDAEADRRHPVKRRRPVAAGEVSTGAALGVGLTLLVAGHVLALAVGTGFLGIVALYAMLTTSYTLWLKHVPVLDIATVASGFVLRAIAGGVAVGVPFSRWFLIVASFGSLFMVAGKRAGEHSTLGEDRGAVRSTLGTYSAEYLRYVWAMASGVTLTAYCLWAFEQAEGRAGVPYYELSIIPFLLFVLRYALLLEGGRGSSPEDLVLGDRGLIAIAATWACIFSAGIYVGR